MLSVAHICSSWITGLFSRGYLKGALQQPRCDRCPKSKAEEALSMMGDSGDERVRD
jgi:hypothetical protein